MSCHRQAAASPFISTFTLKSATRRTRRVQCTLFPPSSLAEIQVQNFEVLNDASQDLPTELEDVVHFIRSHTGILGASRRVPAELVVEIFSHTTESRRVGKAAVPCPPWRLGHICKFWRDVALSVPSLWNSFRIYQPFLNSISRTYSPSMLEAQILRSGDLPLDVSVTWLRGDAAVQMEFWEILLANSHRWGSFYARYKMDSNIDDVLSRIRGRIPLLKEFRLVRERRNSYVTEGDEGYEYLSVAPCLREIALVNNKFSNNSPRLVLPWAQITRYRGRYSLQEQLDIVRAAPNLVECSMGITSDFVFNDSGATAKLPRLCRLFLQPSHDAVNILAHIHAPVLRQ
ncbi:hypothetical protein FB45DRAFT_1094394 [Roridomyces roridus]|uniref:F-box domain-containing protein n=1 Tax=Roridomyces roridus TaxID=1738132 RepID=A0AAD7FHD4_9AGAR|nr:hypothetical protein FB45DRAFT_1094394 [Roridomyces roridus]